MDCMYESSLGNDPTIEEVLLDSMYEEEYYKKIEEEEHEKMYEEEYEKSEREAFEESHAVNSVIYSNVELAIFECIKEMTDNKFWLGLNYIYDKLKENGINEISVVDIKKAVKKLKKNGLVVSKSIYNEDTNQLCGKGWIVK